MQKRDSEEFLGERVFMRKYVRIGMKQNGSVLKARWKR